MPILNSLASNRSEASRGIFLGLRPFINAVNVTSETVDEGQSVTYSVTTLSVPNNTVINWEVTGISINDLSSGSLSGTLTILNNTATTNITLSFTSDFALEGAEYPAITFTMATRSPYTKTITLNDFSRPTLEVDFEPEDTIKVFYSNTSSLFTTTARPINNGPNNYSYTWQLSTNEGGTWSNVSSSIFDPPAGGLNQPGTLGVKPWQLNYTYNNALFRCIIKDAINNYSQTTRAARLNISSPPEGAAIFTTIGNTSWTVPANVYAISVFAVGGGGGGGPHDGQGGVRAVAGAGGGGGGTIASAVIGVVPGQVLTITVGARGIPGSINYNVSGWGTNSPTAGGNSSVLIPATGSYGSITFTGTGGLGGGIASTTTNQLIGASGGLGGSGNITGDTTRVISGTGSALYGSGGQGGSATRSSWTATTSGDSRAGGGAAGYGGAGGAGAYGRTSTSGMGSSGGGGGGGGGGYYSGGGGVLWIPGTSGAGGFSNYSTTTGYTGIGGRGGSGGDNGADSPAGSGGNYGGGGATYGWGAQGAVRIIYGVAYDSNNNLVARRYGTQAVGASTQINTTTY